MAVDNGCVNDLACTGLFASGTTDLSAGTEMVKYFKVVKDCGVTYLEGNNCFTTKANQNYDGSSSTNNNISAWKHYQFITADGMSVLIYNDAHNCDSNVSYNTAIGNLSQYCGVVWVDVNGLKGPNYLGRDIFYFFITNGKGALLYPYGGADYGSSIWWNGTTKHCTTDSSNRDGSYCTGRVMEEGWEMNY